MAFRHPLRAEYSRLISSVEDHLRGRGVEAAAARIGARQLGAFVDMVEAEGAAETPGSIFLHAQLVVVANMLAATVALTVPRGQQRDALKEILRLFETGVGARLDAPKGAPLFVADLDVKKLDHV